MTVTANCQYDSLVTVLATAYGLSNNALFDRLVLQASQRLGGNISAPITVASARAQLRSPGDPAIPASSGIRFGVGGD